MTTETPTRPAKLCAQCGKVMQTTVRKFCGLECMKAEQEARRAEAKADDLQREANRIAQKAQIRKFRENIDDIYIQHALIECVLTSVDKCDYIKVHARPFVRPGMNADVVMEIIFDHAATCGMECRPAWEALQAYRRSRLEN